MTTFPSSPFDAEYDRLGFVRPDEDAQIDESKLSLDALDGGPPGSYGFRRGLWTVIYDGQKFRFYCSVPHRSELDTQHRMVLAAAARHISAKIRAGRWPADAE